MTWVTAYSSSSSSLILLYSSRTSHVQNRLWSVCIKCMTWRRDDDVAWKEEREEKKWRRRSWLKGMFTLLIPFLTLLLVPLYGSCSGYRFFHSLIDKKRKRGYKVMRWSKKRDRQKHETDEREWRRILRDSLTLISHVAVNSSDQKEHFPSNDSTKDQRYYREGVQEKGINLNLFLPQPFKGMHTFSKSVRSIQESHCVVENQTERHGWSWGWGWKQTRQTERHCSIVSWFPVLCSKTRLCSSSHVPRCLISNENRLVCRTRIRVLIKSLIPLSSSSLSLVLLVRQTSREGDK